MTLTTYEFPETPARETGQPGASVIFILPASPGDAERELLGRIATALKADPDRDVAWLIPTATDPIALPSAAGGQVRLVMSFGVTPESFGLWIDLPASGLRKLEAFTLITTISPTRLATDTHEKKLLWGHMQDFLDGQ